jgi:predicted NAD/FAD-binding protein
MCSGWRRASIRFALASRSSHCAGAMADCIELGSGAFQGRYDQVVLACHSDQSALLLARDFPQRAQWLRRIPYQHNHVVLHSDPRVLPRRRKLWSAWNYQAVSSAAGARRSPALAGRWRCTT